MRVMNHRVIVQPYVTSVWISFTKLHLSLRWTQTFLGSKFIGYYCFTKVLCLNILMTSNSDPQKAASSVRSILSSIKPKFTLLQLSQYGENLPWTTGRPAIWWDLISLTMSVVNVPLLHLYSFIVSFFFELKGIKIISNNNNLMIITTHMLIPYFHLPIQGLCSAMLPSPLQQNFCLLLDHSHQ